MIDVSVIIVNWNARDDLACCLNSLRKQTFQPLEVIVIDNGSTDGSVELLRRLYPEVRLVENRDNLGFAEAMNRGISASHGSWIAALNNDAEAEPRWLETLVAEARNGDSRLGMLQSRIVFKHAPEFLNSTGIAVFLDGRARDRRFGKPVAGDDSKANVFCASAGAALYRRSMLEDVRLDSGYFDRAYFMYFEDVDLGWRARLAGWTCRYVPDAVVRHAYQQSSRRQPGQFVGSLIKVNRLRTLLKNASLMYLASASARTFVDVACLLWWERTAGLWRLASAGWNGMKQRSSVSAIAREGRRTVERRWANRLFGDNC